MLLSRSLLTKTGAAFVKLTSDHRRPRKVSTVLIVEHRDEFFAGLASVLASEGLCVKRAATADEATQNLCEGIPDLILANCELPDESGWLMASKWCLTRQPKRVWLYQAWPAVFDQDWVELTKVERILYYEGDLLGLAEQVRSQLAFERG